MTGPRQHFFWNKLYKLVKFTAVFSHFYTFFKTHTHDSNMSRPLKMLRLVLSLEIYLYSSKWWSFSLKLYIKFQGDGEIKFMNDSSPKSSWTFLPGHPIFTFMWPTMRTGFKWVRRGKTPFSPPPILLCKHYFLKFVLIKDHNCYSITILQMQISLKKKKKNCWLRFTLRGK